MKKEKIDKKTLQKLFDDAEVMLVVTNKGIAVHGDVAAILTCYTQLTKALKQDIDEELLHRAHNMGFMNTKELLELLKEELNKKIDTNDTEN